MPLRKRAHSELEKPVSDEAKTQPQSLLARIRNDWHFANIMQFIYLFGKPFKIDDDFDIEDFEMECMKPGHSEKLAEIALTLLKHISSHRGLTPQLFDEYTRRQFVAKAPSRNPFGEAEEPLHFADFDTFTKLRVLWQLTQWVMMNPDRFREKFPDIKDSEQLQWRIEEFGYDREDRLYYLLDDNRFYRRTDPPIPPPMPKAKKPKTKARPKPARTSRRTRRSEVIEEDDDEEEEEVAAVTGQDDLTSDSNQQDNDFGDLTWECIAVTLQDYEDFINTISKTKDPNERFLIKRLQSDVIPIIQKQEENRQRKIAARERELLNLERLATAKRSSRIASRADKERAEAEAEAAEQQRKATLAAAKADALRQKQLDEARQSRMQTREQRLKEREFKRVLHEEQVTMLAEQEKQLTEGTVNRSERQLKSELKRKREELEELQQEEDWFFDCAKCGVHGENVDDGAHSIACERCNVWQHSACLGITQEDAEKDDFHFICQDCRHREMNPKPPSTPIKIKLKVQPKPVVAEAGPEDAAKREKKRVKTSTPKIKPEQSAAGTTATYQSHAQPIQPNTLPPMHTFQHQMPKPQVNGKPAYQFQPPYQPMYQPQQAHLYNYPSQVTPSQPYANGYQQYHYAPQSAPSNGYNPTYNAPPAGYNSQNHHSPYSQHVASAPQSLNSHLSSFSSNVSSNMAPPTPNVSNGLPPSTPQFAPRPSQASSPFTPGGYGGSPRLEPPPSQSNGNSPVKQSPPRPAPVYQTQPSPVFANAPRLTPSIKSETSVAPVKHASSPLAPPPQALNNAVIGASPLLPTVPAMPQLPPPNGSQSTIERQSPTI